MSLAVQIAALWAASVSVGFVVGRVLVRRRRRKLQEERAALLAEIETKRAKIAGLESQLLEGGKKGSKIRLVTT